MNSTVAPSAAHDWLRPIRYAYRVPLLVLHMLMAIPVALLTQNAWFARHGRGEPWDQRCVRWWTRNLLRIFGIHVHPVGTPLPDPVMFVANHVSWLDIELVHSQRAVCFVAKSEISHWPLIGWMAKRGGTIFHKRGSNDSLQRVMATMAERLQHGRAVAAFPEGRSGNGHELGVFHARIFQAALDGNAPIQPVALRYARNGVWWPGVAFQPGESFFANAWRLIGAPPFQVELHFMPPLEGLHDGRRHLADHAREAIAAVLEEA